MTIDWDQLHTVGDVVLANACRFGDKPAFIMANGSSRSFMDFAARVLRLNNAMQLLGLKKGDRVAILSKNRIEYVEACGVSLSGLIPMPLNWRLAPRELAAVLDDSLPAALIADDTFREIVDELRPKLSFVRHFICFEEGNPNWLGYGELLAAATERSTDVAVSPDETACLLYTSGTTGQPKGAELTHRGLLRNCRAAIDPMLHLTPDDMTMAPMPFFHVGGMWYHLFPSFAAGCTTLIVPEFSPREVLRLMQEHRVTNLHLVPTMIHALLQQPDVADFDLGALRLMFYAASNIPMALLKRATKAFSHCGFVQGYGSTEGGMISCLTEADHRRASHHDDAHLLMSCGRPLHDVGVKLAAGSEDAAGGIGEIVIQSRMTMARYWRNPDATRDATAGGVLHTGDLGRIDDEGYLYILDRKSDMIVTGGENVYPREVEDALFCDPAVLEAAVFDLPDDRWVQRVVAAVVLAPGSKAKPVDIIENIKQRLASYKCPKQVFVLPTLPKNGAGKVLRKILRAQFAGEIETV